MNERAAISPCGVHRYHRRGFTLVELMIALVLSILLLGGVGLLYLSARVSAIDAERLARTQEALRFASTFLVQDLRMAGYKRESDFAELLNGGSGIVIRYQAPRDCTGQPTSPPEEDDEFTDPGLAVNTYRVIDNQLVCIGRLSDIPAVLVDGVQSVEFTLEQPLDSPHPLWARIALTMLPGAGHLEGRSYNFSVAFRNPILRYVSDE